MSDNYKVPPRDIESERAVLGSLLIDPKVIDDCFDVLKSSDFYDKKHSLIYQAITDLHKSNKSYDLICLCDDMRNKNILDKVGGALLITQLANQVPSSANFKNYMKIVRNKAILRKMISIGSEIIEKSFNCYDAEDLVNEMENKINNLSNLSSADEYYFDMTTVCHETFKYIEMLYERKGQIIGVPSGYSYLDHLTAGFQPGNFIILAARPSLGKTAMSLNFALNAAKAGKKVGFISLEMTRKQLNIRLLSHESKVDSNEIRRGNIHDTQWSKISLGFAKISKLPIFIIDNVGEVPLIKLRSIIRKLHMKEKLDMLIIDYLQLISSHSGGRSENRQQEVSSISRSLKLLAVELNIPIIALSQLSRKLEERQDKRPMLSDLRESGGLEQDADVVMFIFRPGVYSTDDDSDLRFTELNVAKQRDGPLGTVFLNFNMENGEFIPANFGDYEEVDKIET